MPATEQKISFVGAGSAVFVAGVVGDLLHTPELNGSHLTLMDTNRDRLSDVAQVTRKLINELGVRFTVEETTDMRKAIKNSDFVINAALAGGKEGRMREKKAVHEATGIYGPIEAHAPFAQLILTREIGRTIATLAPNATLIQAANPMPEALTLVERDSHIKAIGICQGYKDLTHLFSLLGMRPELTDAVVAGINHDVWVLELLYQGKNAMPRFEEWAKNVAPGFFEHFLPYALSYDYQITPAMLDLYERYGLIPAGDTVRGQTPEFNMYHTSEAVEQKWFGQTGGRDSAGGADVNNNGRESTLKKFHDAARSNASVRSVFEGRSAGQLVPIITSIATNVAMKHQVNVANHGVIPGLPDDLVVEFPANVDASGVHRDQTFTFPTSVMEGTLKIRAAQAMRHVRAIETGDPQFLLDQLMVNSKIKNRETARTILQIWADLDPNMATHYSLPVSKGGSL